MASLNDLVGGGVQAAPGLTVPGTPFHWAFFKKAEGPLRLRLRLRLRLGLGLRLRLRLGL